MKGFKFLIIATFFVVASTGRAAVLANIGSKEISSQELKSEFENLDSEQKKTINADLMTRKSIVDNFVNAEVLYQAAIKSNLDKDEDYKKALDKFRRQYLASKFMKNTIEPKLSKTQIKEFFNKNKSMFDSTEICAHHIVVEKEETAKQILSKVKAKDANFEEIAMNNSIDPTAQENKGNIGCFTREKMVPEFSDAAFSAKKNDIKGPVKSMFGYHIIKIDDRKPGKIPGFDEVEQRAKELLRIKLVKEMLSDLRNKSKVKVNDEEINKFKL